MALLKQHPSLEPVIKEDKLRPHLTVNPESDAYAMLVGEGFLGMVMVPMNPGTKQQLVIIHGVTTAISINLIAKPKAFVWFKRRFVASGSLDARVCSSAQIRLVSS